MSSIELVQVDKSNIVHSFYNDHSYKQSLVDLCYLLVIESLNTGNLIYPSLKHIKKITSNYFSTRTIDSSIKELVCLEVLQKLPRKKSQSYKLCINKPFLRFLLAVYYPDCNFLIENQESKKSDLLQLYNFKNQLEDILKSQAKTDSFLSEISDNIYEIIASCDPKNKSEDELKDEIFWGLLGYNSSEKLMEITSVVTQIKTGKD